MAGCPGDGKRPPIAHFRFSNGSQRLGRLEGVWHDVVLLERRSTLL